MKEGIEVGWKLNHKKGEEDEVKWPNDIIYDNANKA